VAGQDSSLAHHAFYLTGLPDGDHQLIVVELDGRASGQVGPSYAALPAARFPEGG
jgi:hypothetical protein